jgi:L-alanine-DL-glutamate epimerase-like enolase superfamily enzyme
MKTMLGCMVSSSISVKAAAHLSPLIDYADLEANLLIANDSYHGVTVQKVGSFCRMGRVWECTL